ncbi:60 kDa SS-A/Ro ribonucleoprotein-like [Maniola jurtina]|uniref:60 kDa SS-A/Ro ribonucleoprotein-like n=1 Tax=Maniola jurtina TaxID=191418 RepID=UPI001E689190|nr:60 kDa SS-A/Ro ribonucleoprotein-like [Maniola jurtina]
MTSTSTLDTKIRNLTLRKLTRYLHTGKEIPKYYPGCWISHKYFEADKLTAIDVALANKPDDVEIVNIIVKAYKDGWYTRFETIAFALVKCILVGDFIIKEASYKAATEICSTPEEIMQLNKFTRLLRTGNGRGWCKHVQNWYKSKDPMELAKEMTRVRAKYGRSHKTLLRKSHMKVDENDHARDAVVKYAIFGLKRAKNVCGNAEGTKEIFEYIQKVEDLRHCEDPAVAALMVAQNHFTLDHVPGHLLTAQEVWNAVLPQLSLSQVLYYIQRIHNMGFLTNDSETTAILVSLLSNQDIIKKSKVTPIEVYITLCNYKKKSRPATHDKVKVAMERQIRRRARQTYDSDTDSWEWNVVKRHPKELKHWGIDYAPSPAVLAALNKLIDHTWLLTPPTNLRYLITLDMRHHMFKGRHFCKSYAVKKKSKKAKTKPAPSETDDAEETETKPATSKKHLVAECFYNKNVTPGHAAIIIAMQLLKREKDAKLAVFTEEGVQLVSIERNFSNIDEAEFVLRKANLGRVQLDAPIEWASKTNQKFDVFINMVDRTTRYTELEASARGGRGSGGRYGPPPPPTSELVDHCPVRALERYRAKAVRKAKLIVMSLASHRVATTDGSHEGVLDIVGIDEHVPKLIDAFALGQFE